MNLNKLNPKIWGFVLLVNLASVEAAWWESYQDQNLNHFIAKTLDHNADLKAFQEKVKQAEAQEMFTASPLYPSLSLTGNRNWMPWESSSFPGAAQIPNPPDVFSNGGLFLKAKYSLSSLWIHLPQVQMRSAQTETLKEEQTNLRTQTEILVIQNYFNLVFQNAQINLLNSQIQFAENILDMTRLRYQRGEVNVLAVLQQEQNLASLQTKLPTLKSLAKQAEESLGAISGAELGSIAESLPPIKVLETEWLTNRSDLKTAQQKVEIARLQKFASYWIHMPTIDLTASKGYNYTYINSADWQATWQVGVSFNFPIFKGFGDWANQRDAQAQLRMAEFNLEQTKRNAKKEINSSQAEVKNLTESYQAFENYYRASQRTYEEALSQYQKGLISYTDFSQINQAFYQSQTNLLNAHYQVLIGHLVLVQRSGNQL